MVDTQPGDEGPAGWPDHSHGHHESLVFPAMSDQELLKEIPISICYNGRVTVEKHYRRMPVEVETNLDRVATLLALSSLQRKLRGLWN